MPDRPPIFLRPMTEADLTSALYVRKNALEWLERSHGGTPEPWIPAFPAAIQHVLRSDPDGCWVAEMDGVAVGYAQALVRGDIWFLAQLFVLPEAHSAGIGEQLLSAAYAYGQANGARVFSVVASSSPVAQSLYMRRGMFCRGLGYFISGPIEPLLTLPESDGNRKRIVDCHGWQDRIADLDRAVFGAERRQDHEYYLSGDSSSGEQASFGINRDGALLGYGYVTETNGWIAPMAAYDPADQLPLLGMAAEWLHERGVESGNALVVSLNQTLLTALLATGWQIKGWLYLLTSEPFGQFDRYHPSGGMLL